MTMTRCLVTAHVLAALSEKVITYLIVRALKQQLIHPVLDWQCDRLQGHIGPKRIDVAGVELDACVTIVHWNDRG